MEQFNNIHSTTILFVKKNGKICMGGDGQISQGSYIFKSNVKKVRKIPNRNIIAGFAGVTTDALKILNYLNHYIDNYHNLEDACLYMMKEWSKNKTSKIDALMLVTDTENTFLLSGSGDMFRIEENAIGIGSGGKIAQSCAFGLIEHSNLSPCNIVKESLLITSKICLYTNDNLTLETLNCD